MIQSKRRYPNRYFAFMMSWNIQFLIGFMLCVLLPALLAWGSNISTWVNLPPRFWSLIVVVFVYTMSFISLRQFLNYLGILNLRYVVPAIIIWVVLGYGFLFVFRLPYSVYFLSYSLPIMLLFFFFICYTRNRYGEFRVAYIAAGNLSDRDSLPRLKTIHWVELEKPNLNASFQADILTADLRANLSPEWESFLAACTLEHIPVYHSSKLIEATTGRVKIDHLYENDLGSLLPSRSYLLIKRILDVVVILLSAPLILPIILIFIILIPLESKGRPFFIQKRIGEGGKPYSMYKLRSMYTNTVNNKTTDSNDARVTRIGKLIRKTRIDELPQFYNVLKGEMSLIGPRAEFEEFAKEYEKEIPFYNYRHIVKPGISGWAQVMQGYNYGIEETKVKLEHDFYYIKNFSFSLDLLIFFKTIFTIITGSGAR